VRINQVIDKVMPWVLAALLVLLPWIAIFYHVAVAVMEDDDIKGIRALLWAILFALLIMAGGR
jgi:hypothetical protein